MNLLSIKGRWLVLCAMSALWPAFALAAGPALPVMSVGKVNYAGYSTRSSCTGILVAPDRVITAAHCVLATGQKTRKPSEIHFVAGYDRGEYVAHSLGREILLAPGYFKAKSKFERMGLDFAVILLEQPFDIEPVPLTDIGDAKVLNVIHAGYRYTRPEALTIGEPCLLLPREATPWASSCLTAGGSSGGPLFSIAEDGSVSLAAIMVATVGNSASFAMPVTAWRGLVENTATAD